MADTETLADIDLSLLDIQQNLARIVVLVSSVLVLQGLTFLILAWMINGFVVSSQSEYWGPSSCLSEWPSGLGTFAPTGRSNSRLMRPKGIIQQRPTQMNLIRPEAHLLSQGVNWFVLYSLSYKMAGQQDTINVR